MPLMARAVMADEGTWLSAVGYRLGMQSDDGLNVRYEPDGIGGVARLDVSASVVPFARCGGRILRRCRCSRLDGGSARLSLPA